MSPTGSIYYVRLMEKTAELLIALSLSRNDLREYFEASRTHIEQSAASDGSSFEEKCM
jgi:hypothetical protein